MGVAHIMNILLKYTEYGVHSNKAFDFYNLVWKVPHLKFIITVTIFLQIPCMH